MPKVDDYKCPICGEWLYDGEECENCQENKIRSKSTRKGEQDGFERIRRRGVRKLDTQD